MVFSPPPADRVDMCLKDIVFALRTASRCGKTPGTGEQDE